MDVAASINLIKLDMIKAIDFMKRKLKKVWISAVSIYFLIL